MEKPENLKKPLSAYMLCCNDKREEVQKSLGTKDIGEVTKRIAAEWKAWMPFVAL